METKKFILENHDINSICSTNSDKNKILSLFLCMYHDTLKLLHLMR